MAPHGSLSLRRGSHPTPTADGRRVGTGPPQCRPAVLRFTHTRPRAGAHHRQFKYHTAMRHEDPAALLIAGQGLRQAAGEPGDLLR